MPSPYAQPLQYEYVPQHVPFPVQSIVAQLGQTVGTLQERSDRRNAYEDTLIASLAEAPAAEFDQGYLAQQSAQITQELDELSKTGPDYRTLGGVRRIAKRAIPILGLIRRRAEAANRIMELGIRGGHTSEDLQRRMAFAAHEMGDLSQFTPEQITAGMGQPTSRIWAPRVDIMGRLMPRLSQLTPQQWTTINGSPISGTIDLNSLDPTGQYFLTTQHEQIPVEKVNQALEELIAADQDINAQLNDERELYRFENPDATEEQVETSVREQFLDPVYRAAGIIYPRSNRRDDVQFIPGSSNSDSDNPLDGIGLPYRASSFGESVADIQTRTTELLNSNDPLEVLEGRQLQAYVNVANATFLDSPEFMRYKPEGMDDEEWRSGYESFVERVREEPRSRDYLGVAAVPYRGILDSSLGEGARPARGFSTTREENELYRRVHTAHNNFIARGGGTNVMYRGPVSAEQRNIAKATVDSIGWPGFRLVAGDEEAWNTLAEDTNWNQVQFGGVGTSGPRAGTMRLVAGGNEFIVNTIEPAAAEGLAIAVGLPSLAMGMRYSDTPMDTEWTNIYDSNHEIPGNVRARFDRHARDGAGGWRLGYTRGTDSARTLTYRDAQSLIARAAPAGPQRDAYLAEIDRWRQRMGKGVNDAMVVDVLGRFPELVDILADYE